MDQCDLGKEGEAVASRARNKTNAFHYPVPQSSSQESCCPFLSFGLPFTPRDASSATSGRRCALRPARATETTFWNAICDVLVTQSRSVNLFFVGADARLYSTRDSPRTGMGPHQLKRSRRCLRVRAETVHSRPDAEWLQVPRRDDPKGTGGGFATSS
jgi:hypothetical protein